MPLSTISPLLVERLYTAEELFGFPAEQHYELIQGELRELPMPTGDAHGTKTLLLSHYLLQFILENNMGECFAAETGFLLRRNPDTVKAPDFAYVASDRLLFARGGGFVPIVPDIVLETRSPSDRSAAVKQKVEEWLDAGVRLVIDMDPIKRLLTIYRPGMESLTLTFADTLEGYDVLPGFTLPLARLFPEGG